MANPRLIKTGNIDPSEIDAGKRIRPVSEKGVESLMASIRDVGMVKDEVIVRKVKRSGKLVLVAGAHRLEACKRLGMNVPAKIFECNDDWASLLEVHDNLANTDLTALDLALHLGEHKRVYEKLHPETRAGVAGGHARQGQQGNSSSFADLVAETRGISPRQVRKIVAAGETIRPDEVKQLRQAPNPVTLKDLSEIAKIADASERQFVCKSISDGKAKSATEARKTYAGKTNPKPLQTDKTDEAFKTLLKLWTRTSNAARERFVDEVSEELTALMNREAKE